MRIYIFNRPKGTAAVSMPVEKDCRIIRSCARYKLSTLHRSGLGGGTDRADTPSVRHKKTRTEGGFDLFYVCRPTFVTSANYIIISRFLRTSWPLTRVPRNHYEDHKDQILRWMNESMSSWDNGDSQYYAQQQQL